MKKLLEKYIKGDCSAEEKAKIIDWLDTDENNKKEYFELRKSYEFKLWYLGSEYNNIRNQNNILKFGRQLLKVAAIFVLVILGTYIFQRNPNLISSEYCEITVPLGEHQLVNLPDGSKVWLNSGTSLRFPEAFDSKERRVQITGEGFFTVQPDKEKPFIATFEGCEIKVLGTEFNVNAYPGRKEKIVSLIEGSVELTSVSNQKRIILKPYYEALIQENNMEVKAIDSLDKFMWKQGIISFQNESFENVAKRLQELYNIKIEIKSSELYKIKISGKYRQKEGVMNILSVIQCSNNFSIRQNSETGEIEIY
ncbi:FecR family protein [Maribellus luteus]|uniref:FecR family protein n=1 Tax=Maribellus luteus TaxID=2305463 RepID=A0A399SZK6_9BACT|nr:FecR family protein [Maribellus luteus]RIJ48042.1 FecR family protein [Maribellus luteus]